MDNKKNTDKKIIIISAVILVVLISVFGSVYLLYNENNNQSDSSYSIAENHKFKSYSLEVIDKDKKVKKYAGKTEGKYLIDIMNELSEQGDFSYWGEDSVYGIYVKEINGIKTENMNKAYWAFYVNDKYCSHGVSSQTVSDGDEFKIVYEEI